MSVTDELAKQRNRDAAERTLMAWIRTCLSLISFGFGLDKIIGAIRSQAGLSGQAGLGVQMVSVSFVVTGVLALTLATLQHRRHVRRLNRNDVTYQAEPSIAMATAVIITLTGVVALAMLLVGAMAT
jgi:putative membrane protein